MIRQLFAESMKEGDINSFRRLLKVIQPTLELIVDGFIFTQSSVTFICRAVSGNSTDFVEVNLITLEIFNTLVQVMLIFLQQA